MRSVSEGPGIQVIDCIGRLRESVIRADTRGDYGSITYLELSRFIVTQCNVAY